MENQKNDNLNMLEAIVQNTEMGKNTLDQLVPMAEDEQFKAELLRQRNIYRQLNQEAHAAIDACGGSAQGQSAMAKLNTKVSIGMKTITDKSTRNLAEMLTQGSGMGVVDCIKSQKDYPDAAPGSKRLMQKLQDFEEDNRELEQYLKFSFARQKRTRKAPATFEAREARIKGCSPLIIPMERSKRKKASRFAKRFFLASPICCFAADFFRCCNRKSSC